MVPALVARRYRDRLRARERNLDRVRRWSPAAHRRRRRLPAILAALHGRHLAVRPRRAVIRRRRLGSCASGPVPGGAQPSCSAGSPSACPTNKFKIGSQHATHRGTTFRVNVPGAGTVSIRATKRTRGVHKHRNAAGVVKLVVKPTTAGRRALKDHSQITARTTVTFTPDGGLPKSTKARIKFIR